MWRWRMHVCYRNVECLGCKIKGFLHSTVYWRWKISYTWYTWYDRRGCHLPHWLTVFLALLDVECEDSVGLLCEMRLRTDSTRQDLHQYICLHKLKNIEEWERQSDSLLYLVLQCGWKKSLTLTFEKVEFGCPYHALLYLVFPFIF